MRALRGDRAAAYRPSYDEGMAHPLPAIAILGAGSMGGAILQGLLASGRASRVTVTNRTRAKAEALTDAAASASAALESIALEVEPEGNARAAASADIVLIGVKPGMVPDLLDEIAPHLRPGARVVSLAAGVTIATFEAHLPAGAIVLRSMPNTPAVVGKAVTGLAPGSAAAPDDVATVRAVFETCGAVIEVGEEQIDALSTISGSVWRGSLPASSASIWLYSASWSLSGLSSGGGLAGAGRGGRTPSGISVMPLFDCSFRTSTGSDSSTTNRRYA